MVDSCRGADSLFDHCAVTYVGMGELDSTRELLL
jgi:hypothetical protein